MPVVKMMMMCVRRPAAKTANFSTDGSAPINVGTETGSETVDETTNFQLKLLKSRPLLYHS